MPRPPITPSTAKSTFGVHGGRNRLARRVKREILSVGKQDLRPEFDVLDEPRRGECDVARQRGLNELLVLAINVTMLRHRSCWTRIDRFRLRHEVKQRSSAIERLARQRGVPRGVRCER